MAQTERMTEDTTAALKESVEDGFTPSLEYCGKLLAEVEALRKERQVYRDALYRKDQELNSLIASVGGLYAKAESMIEVGE